MNSPAFADEISPLLNWASWEIPFKDQLTKVRNQHRISNDNLLGNILNVFMLIIGFQVKKNHVPVVAITVRLKQVNVSERHTQTVSHLRCCFVNEPMCKLPKLHMHRASSLLLSTHTMYECSAGISQDWWGGQAWLALALLHEQLGISLKALFEMLTVLLLFGHFYFCLI